MDTTAASEALHQAEAALFNISVTRSLALAGFCLLLYDHTITIAEEIDLVWNQKWSMISTLFVINRYTTPVVIIIDVVDKGGIAWFLPRSFCLNWYYVEAIWNIFCFAVIHGIVALRVHAIWGRARWLTVSLIAFFVIYLVSTGLITFTLQKEYAHTVAYNYRYHVCFCEISSHLWLCWLPGLLFESYLFMLTMRKAFEHWKQGFNIPLLHVLYRDGVIHFGVIAFCSTFAMITWIFAPPSLIGLAKYFVISIVPTMGSRLVLNLRSSHRELTLPTDTLGPETSYELTTTRSSYDVQTSLVFGQGGMTTWPGRRPLSRISEMSEYQRFR